jgi:hypothetical protein
MTSSATQTEADGVTPRDPPSDPGGDRSGGQPPAPGGGLRERLARWVAPRVELVAAGVLVVAGWVLILAINRWHLGAPAVFLCLGWLSIVAAGRLLWIAAVRGGSDLDGLPETIEPVGETRVEELEREKKALLKAIKEVEFDRELGKMSNEDADEIVRVYRARAIEILKLLDDGGALGESGDEPALQVIEREVRARLALAGVKTRVKAAAKKEDEGVKS